MNMSAEPVFEMRIALTASDYERIVNFYCKGLGIEPTAIWNNDGGKAMMLNMGNATLELFDERQAEVIDDLEAGKAHQRTDPLRLSSARPARCHGASPRPRRDSRPPARYDSVGRLQRPPARSRRDASHLVSGDGKINLTLLLRRIDNPPMRRLL
jgi:hypothetical protein